MEIMLLCTRCARLLPEASFQRDTERARGFQCWCRGCMAETNAAYHKAHRETRNARNLRRYHDKQAAKKAGATT